MSQLAAQAARRWGRLPANVRGALWILIAGLCFSVLAALVKSLGARYDPIQLAFFRSGFGLVALLPIIARRGPSVYVTRRPLNHLLRNIAGIASMLTGFYALVHLPLAMATAISFATPLFMIFVAVLLLGETVRWRRWSATAVGFLGVLVMIRPGAGGVPLAPAAVAVGSALLVAWSIAEVKKLSATDAPLTIVCWFATISTGALTIPAIVVWVEPTWLDLAKMLAVGGLGSFGQVCMIRAMRSGDATAVMPFDYVRLIYAGVIGYFAFAELPDAFTLLGAAVIVASTFYIAQREARLGRRATTLSAGAGDAQPN